MSPTVALHTSRIASQPAPFDQHLHCALNSSSSAWVQAALRQAQLDPLEAAMNALALASALAQQASRFLEAEIFELAEDVERRFAS